MTAAILSIALVLSPTPLADHPQPEETPQWPTSASLEPVVFVETPLTSSASDWAPLWDLDPSPPTTVETPADVGTVAIPPPTTTLPPPILSPIETGMNRLAELGASPYQLRVFACLAWFESRNDPYAVSRTNDKGLWQINNYWHAWRWRGRDIFDPVVNAEVAWDIYSESGWRAWSTHWSCGV